MMEFYFATMNYSVMKRNEILIQSPTWMNPEIIVLSERSRHKGHILYDSTHMKCPE